MMWHCSSLFLMCGLYLLFYRVLELSLLRALISSFFRIARLLINLVSYRIFLTCICNVGLLLSLS